MRKTLVSNTIAIVCLALTAISQAHADDQTATLVKLTETFNWTVPSPDPAGVVFVAGANSLFVADSEVNETVVFNGSNLFQTGLDGSVYELFSTLDFTDEPTGITVNPANGHLFISTDNAPRRIHEINPGPDGIYRNADDTMTSFSTTLFNSTDAEGITYNPDDGRLYIADGLSNLVHIVDPGPNQLFDGIASVGDDTVTSFDTSSLGIIDPEGITYDALTDALYIIGEPVNQLLHVSTSGELLRLITLDSPLLNKPAGLTIGPSSLNNGADSLYLVDRGTDNDYDPAENDGRMFEFTLPPIGGNVVPTVNISAPLANQSFAINTAVTFIGSAMDPEDGDLSEALVWESDLDGMIGTGSEFSTSSLSLGSHSITASCIDSSQAQALASLTLRIMPEGTVVIESRIDSSRDDAEQRGLSGNTWLTGNDLELIDDNSVEQIVGLRFNGLQIPTYATIEEAYIRFVADESQSAGVSLAIRAQASDNAEPFQSRKRNLTNRLITNAASSWQPDAWPTVGESSTAQKTSDLAAMVHEVVNRPGWSAGNSMAFLIMGSGPARRTAESFDGEPGSAPLLYVRYTGSPSTAPMLIISSPANGDSFTDGTAVSFSATANDAQDGNLGSSISWNSDLDGPLGSGVSVTAPSLSAGTHLVTATVSDSGGLSSSAAISITIAPLQNTEPLLTVTAPADGSQVNTATLVSLAATATDAQDGDLSGSVSWSSNLNGNLGTGSPDVYLSEGLHTITALVSDSLGLAVSASVTLQVDAAVGAEITLDVRVSTGSDDAEERDNKGRMALTSSDLEMVMDGNRDQIVGLRFNDLQIPKDAGIVSASIQFQVEEPSSDLAFLNIAIQQSDDTATFSLETFNISSRPRSAVSTLWLPSPWENRGGAGPAQRTPDLSGLVQHIVSRDNWTPGNSMAFLIDGDGNRTAASREGQPEAAPQLSVTYTLGNSAPTVETSGDLTLAVSDTAFISGTVGDDGIPSDSGLPSYQWSVADGPGLVTFSDATSLSTSVSFDTVGTYVLILSVSDGQLSAYEELTATVEPSAQNLPPSVMAGPDLQGAEGETLMLFGMVTDDGLPASGIQDNINWTQLSGPATAILHSASSASTGAELPEAGTYTFELSAFDGELLSSDQVVATIVDPAGNGSVAVQITDGNDDAEESALGDVDLSSSDLELIKEKSNQIVGLRFKAIQIPNDATITNAYIQFTADEVDTQYTELVIQAESTDDSAEFTSLDGSLTSRPQTSTSVTWTPPAWETRGASNETQQTPDLTTVIQEIVNRSGWISGNALSIIISGSGTRTAESYDGVPESAARLFIDYQIVQ